jgi:hypothetical protein
MIVDQAKYIGSVIFICSETGEEVETGHRMRTAEFESVVGSRSFRCRTCGQVHSWTAETARLGGQRRPASMER